MKRLAFLGMAVIGLTTGVAACGNSPVQPGVSTAAFDPAPTEGRKPSYPTVTTTNCGSVVYPTSLCLPPIRAELCAALRTGGQFDHMVSYRPATQTFTRNSTNTGAVETVTIPRPYGLPSTVLTFAISDQQIESAGMCLGVATA